VTGNDCSGDFMKKKILFSFYKNTNTTLKFLFSRSVLNLSAMNAQFTHASFMWKQGAINTGWKRRWFALTSNNLLYFKEMKAKGKPLGSIPLDGCFLERDPSRENALRLVHPERRIYYFAPENEVKFSLSS
jgi:hypothetical protein